MGILFISHSSIDNEAAVCVRKWLMTHGWGQVFLDLDPAVGLAPGQRWQQELKRAGERCSGVLVLVSPNWVSSRWCQTEFLVADQLGKKIFPVLIAPTPLGDIPQELVGRFQFADISTAEKQADGFDRLAIGLKRSGLDPQSFQWPPPNEPHRAIYRGLQSLDDEDAAIFFGRDAFITKGMDAIRRIRNGAPERMLVILGASGAGKSSFLKAGLIARLKRDEENFLTLPVIRPERAALTGSRGLAASVGCDPEFLISSSDFVRLIADLRHEVIERLRHLAEYAHEHYATKSPTVVIALDQAEELFVAENAEAAHVLDLLAGVVRADANTIVVATMRSDSFTKLQQEPRFADISLQPFSLPPLPMGAFKEVIEGPARLADPPLAVEPALSDRLLQDLAADDALPLLAFTLERLSARHRGGGTLTVGEYLDFGGLQGAILSAIEAAFAEARRDSALPDSRPELESLARAAFIPCLIHLDDANAEPRRRVERRSALPEATQRLVSHLIDQRLLVSNRSIIDGIETDTVEVAHEAILRQWPSLRAWITEERDALRALDAVRGAAAEWNRHADSGNGNQSQSWLAHRSFRLQEAEALLTRPGFITALGSTELRYLAACRANESAEQQREQLGIARTRRLQRNVGILIGIGAVVVLLAGLSIMQLLAGMTTRISSTLAAQAASESNSGNYDRAARYALAGLLEASWPLTDYGTKAEAELRGAAGESSALVVMRGHDNQVLSAAFSHDGKRIATASRDATARIWDANTGRQIRVLRGHAQPVLSAAFSLDGTRLVTASADQTARIWDATTGHQLRVLRGHEDAVVSAAFNPEGSRIVTASDDGTARTWDAKSGRQLSILRGHEDRVTAAAFNSDGTRIITVSADKTARVWDSVTDRQVLILRGHTNVVESGSFSSDGERIVTASDDRTTRIWDAATGRQLAILFGNAGFSSASFNHDGTLVATASRDNTAGIWNVSTGSEIAVLRGHEDLVNAVMFSPDGRRIVTASDDKSARVWDANVGRHVVIFRGHEGAVNSASFSSEGTRIVTASSDGTAHIWNVRTGQVTVALRGHLDIVETAAFNPKATRIITASDDKTARVWAAGTGTGLSVLRGHRGAVYGAVFSPDGSRIVTASNDGTARIWNAETARQLIVLRGHTNGVNSASFSPDGSRIVTSSGDGTARIWNAATGHILAVLRGHLKGVTSAVFGPTGTRVVTAGRDGTARIWDANTGRKIAILRGHDDAVLSATFSPDGKRIVTASRDKTARIWDADTAEEIAVLRGHQGVVTSAAFGPTGNYVVTASDDGTVRLWSISANIYSLSRDALIQQICGTVFADGVGRFSANELRAAPMLDPQSDTDACRPVSLWSRVLNISAVNFR